MSPQGPDFLCTTEVKLAISFKVHSALLYMQITWFTEHLHVLLIYTWMQSTCLCIESIVSKKTTNTPLFILPVPDKMHASQTGRTRFCCVAWQVWRMVEDKGVSYPATLAPRATKCTMRVIYNKLLCSVADLGEWTKSIKSPPPF